MHFEDTPKDITHGYKNQHEDYETGFRNATKSYAAWSVFGEVLPSDVSATAMVQFSKQMLAGDVFSAVTEKHTPVFVSGLFRVL